MALRPRAFFALLLAPLLLGAALSCTSTGKAPGAEPRGTVEGTPAPIPGGSVRVIGEEIPTKYDFSKTTAEIGSMHPKGVHRMPGWKNPGYTHYEASSGSSFRIQGRGKGDGGPLEAWVEDLTVRFSLVRMDVHATRDHPKGSCAFQAILGHEEEHVAIVRRAYRKYRILLEEALARPGIFPTRDSPLRVATLEEGRKIVEERIGKITAPLFEAFDRECVSENAKIDTLESYRELQKRCAEW